jgi:hypothetical protein
MGNCLPHKIRLEVDEDNYDSALDEILEQIRTDLATQKRHKVDIRIRARNEARHKAH